MSGAREGIGGAGIFVHVRMGVLFMKCRRLRREKQRAVVVDLTEEKTEGKFLF